MKEDALTFRAYTRIAPGLPFAKHTSRVGCSTAVVSSHHTGITGGPSCVRVVALLASKRRVRRVEDNSRAGGALEHADGVASEGKKDTQRHDVGKCCAGRASAKMTAADDATTPPRHLYARIQYDKSVVETLPLELVREQHPQLLIDYLLANAVWR